MTPLKRYRAQLKQADFVRDPVQERAVLLTERLYHQLLQGAPRKRRGWRRLLPGSPVAPVRGLYFWGGVGRGKSYVVDTFFESLPIANKRRVHFHRFMGQIHAELRGLKGVSAPLNEVAGRWAERARVVCLDEFHVSDITDAMLLSGLLDALMARGVVLVTSSNEAPDRLYWDGLQRQRFLPAIELIKEHLKVFCFEGDTDYRLRALEKAEIYHWPLDDGAQRALAYAFEHVLPAGELESTVEVNDRQVPAVRHGDGVVWFDFDVICGGPRAVPDYIEIGRTYHTVMIGRVPVMDDQQRDAARRFIHLVDELYDRNVKLIVSAAAPPEALYDGRRLAAPFRRTASRLVEMQSHKYLARPHLCD